MIWKLLEKIFIDVLITGSCLFMTSSSTVDALLPLKDTRDTPATCNAHGSVRLVGGSDDSRGRLEFCKDKKWGTVCDDGFGESEARVVCRQLDFENRKPVVVGKEEKTKFGEGEGPIQLDDVKCTGWEEKLQDCSYIDWGTNCFAYEFVGIDCILIEEGTARLVGGQDEHSGRVEVYYNGRWGTVCGGDTWDARDGEVICRQLGFSYVAVHKDATQFGPGFGRPIHLSNVDCIGNESKLSECRHNDVGNNNCKHFNDAGVTCSD